MITGSVHADQRAPGGYEMHVQDFEIISLAQEYPITPKEHGTTFLMDHRHLWHRSKKQNAILRIRFLRLLPARVPRHCSRQTILIPKPI